ncbi:MAG: serine/threonine-protein kinase [Pseudomonadota bacterium]
MSDSGLKADERARRILQRLTGSSDSLEASESADTSNRVAERLHQIEQLFLLHGGQRSDLAADDALFEWGHLQVLESIGQGSFGEVYRAYDRALDRQVALKLLKTDDHHPFKSQLFLHEGRQLAMVRHRNVLAVHGAAVHDGRPGLWTDLIDGQTAQHDEYQERLSRLEPRLEFIESIAQALQAVHASGLVHGDIKPGNVMRDAAGEWILMDFGASLDYRSTEQAPPIASGTPLYMAPEVVLGAAPNTKTDIYSMGAFFYRVLVGEPPFDVQQWSELEVLHESGQEATRARLAEDPQGRVGALIDRMLSIDPDQRPDPAQILAEIQGIREAPHRRFRRLALGAIGGVLIAGFVASSLGFLRAEHALEQANAEQANAQAVNRFLQRVMQTPSSTGRVRDFTVEDMLRFAAVDAQDALADQPQARVLMRRVLADSFNVLDLPALALEQIETARSTLAKNGLSMPVESRFLDLMEIRALEIEERHEDSLALAVAFVDRHLENLGDDDPQIRWARIYQVTNLLGLTRYEQALPILEAYFTDIPTPDSAERDFGYGILQSWVNVHKGLGQFDEALARAEEAVEWLDRHPRARPFHTASALGNLALALSDVNQQDRALDVYNEMLPLYERVFGTGSSDHIGLLINRASAEREAGRLREAQESMEQALGLMRRFPESSKTEMELIVQMNLANLLNGNGNADQAEAMMRQSLVQMRGHWGETHRTTLVQEYNLAELLNQQRRFDEARELAEQTLATKREILDDLHPLTLLSMDNLAVALNGLGRGEEALALHDRALAAATEGLGSEHPYTLLIERNRVPTLQTFAPERIGAGEIEALIHRHETALGADHFDTEKARALLD